MTTKHKIRAYLYDNVLTKDNPNDYTARTVSERSLNVKQICEAAVSRGGADMTTSAMERAAELFLKEMAYQLCDGYSINTGYFTAGTQIRGTFKSPVEAFDTQKHSLIFQFNQGHKLRTEIPNVEVDILGIADASCKILQITDVYTESVNSQLTIGRNLRIKGTKIKITGGHPANGIFFVNTGDNSRTKVDDKDIVINKPSELMIVIPNLPVGSYQLEISTQYTSNSFPLKVPRIIAFDKKLTVE